LKAKKKAKQVTQSKQASEKSLSVFLLLSGNASLISYDHKPKIEKPLSRKTEKP
jgi:hypothetical protein